MESSGSFNSKLSDLINDYFQDNGAIKYANTICKELLEDIEITRIIEETHPGAKDPSELVVEGFHPPDQTTDEQEQGQEQGQEQEQEQEQGQEPEQLHQFSDNKEEHIIRVNDEKYLNILEKFFLTRFNVDTKLRYGYKRIQTHLINLKNESNKIFYESYIYLYTDLDGKFNKMYIIKGGTENITCIFSIFKIIREIAIQQYAHNLTLESCKDMQFVIPEITCTAQKISIDGVESIIINLNMVKLTFKNNKQKYIDEVFKLSQPSDDSTYATSYDIQDGFQNRVKLHKIIAKFLDCLEFNGIKHKDTHNENIEFLHDSGNTPVEFKLALLDFGQATVSSDFTTTSTITGIPRKSFTYITATESDNTFYTNTKDTLAPNTEQSKAIDELMEIWLKPRDEQIKLRGKDAFGFIGIERYGGKNKRTKKSKKSRKQKKRISIKNAKRKTRKSPI